MVCILLYNILEAIIVREIFFVCAQMQNNGGAALHLFRIFNGVFGLALRGPVNGIGRGCTCSARDHLDFGGDDEC